MGRSDYERPADYQIMTVSECRECGWQHEQNSFYAPPCHCCCCGGQMSVIGESYPSNADDWHMERSDINDDWRHK